MMPSMTVALSTEDARKAMNLVEKLEELDDVQAVHSNFDIPDELV